MPEERIKAREIKRRRTKTIVSSVMAVLFFLGCVVFYITDGFGIRVVQPKENVAAYNVNELTAIGMQINESKSDEEAVSVVEKYHVVDTGSSGQPQDVRKRAQDTINARIEELKKS